MVTSRPVKLPLSAILLMSSPPHKAPVGTYKACFVAADLRIVSRVGSARAAGEPIMKSATWTFEGKQRDSHLKKPCSMLFSDVRMGHLNNEVRGTLVTLAEIVEHQVIRKVGHWTPVPDPDQLEVLPLLHLLGEVPAQCPVTNHPNPPHHPYQVCPEGESSEM